MTVVAHQLAAPAFAEPRAVVPCLTAGPVAGPIISALFGATVLLFLLAVFALAV